MTPLKQHEAKRVEKEREKAEAPTGRAPRGKNAAALAAELEKMQQEAMRLKAQLQALQQQETHGKAPTSPSSEGGSTIMTPQRQTTCASSSGNSSDGGDVWSAIASPKGGSSEVPSPRGDLIEVTLAVRNTFLSLVPLAPEGACQRNRSAPPAARGAAP